MTLVSLFSLKGAPGVTTLACLLGAAWPGARPVVLIEADPAGGDLAARFGLSARVGWASLASSTRRSGGIPSLGPHLQTLPGGLPVLVAARGDERRSVGTDEGAAVRSGRGATPEGASGLTIVDLGRLGAGDVVSESWLAISDVSLLVVSGDASSAVHVRDRHDRLAAVCEERLGVVVVGGSYSGQDLEDFTGVRPVADLPFDLAAADVASGGPGSGRRLERSPLWSAVVRMASSLDARIDNGWDRPDDLTAPAPAPASLSDVRCGAGAPGRVVHGSAVDATVPGRPAVSADEPTDEPTDGRSGGPSRGGRRPLRDHLRRGNAATRRFGPPGGADDDRRVDA